ncbi:MAG: hypothetical protein J7L73_00095 [Anaerolineales bacterium]|nr:hypothetical protein [Anaerolineales bacterium]
MKTSFRWISLAVVVLLCFGCSIVSTPTTPTIIASSVATIEKTLPAPNPQTTTVPDPKETVQSYLDAWKNDDYGDMYGLLTTISQDAISEEAFTKWYKSILAESAVVNVDYEILSAFVRDTHSAQVGFRTILQSVLVGSIERETVMNLSLEQGDWRVQWADNLVIPELAGDNYLWMDRHIPSRANIYDRNGKVIVAFSKVVSVGIIPGEIDPDTEEDLLNQLQWLTGIHPNTIAQLYADFPPGSDWYLPLGEVTFDRVQQRFDVSNGYHDNGLVMFPYESRFYFENGIAPQAVGYVSLIQEDEVEKYKRLGYNQDEKVGRQGIERWGEPYLGGTRGGTLYVIGPDDKVVTKLADVPAKPSQAIYTTLDKDLQLGAQEALKKFNGAIVILERNTGRVLAMASSPEFDPNAFEPSNYNYSALLAEIYDQDGGNPLLNRATQGQYPLGSVFKIITMAAALESGIYTPESTYDCQYSFDEIQGLPPRYDWTWDHFQHDGKTRPSGMLTLPEGLMRSCNPFFWHIGLDLYRRGLTDAVAKMAHGFGLGSPTGIEGVEEEAGQIPVPRSEVDAINLAIGQGNTLVTPIQVARFIAAIGNGGLIYRPQIIDRIVPPDGEPVREFEPIVDGTLPISPENLKVIQDALISVVENPRGTAQWILAGMSKNYYPLAGKTGTAESGSGEPHAWFVGYTRKGRQDKPDIAIVVIAENGGEGSEVAAPIFRAMVQLYFEGGRGTLPWESQPGVLATPEPENPDE